ncbi:DUF2189 domain-containing protein [Roseivivax sp. CAU 1753]
MTSKTARMSAPVPRNDALRVSELIDILRLGWRDFRRAPVYGLFFSGVYVLIGLALMQIGAGLFTWTLTLSLGFPLIAPFLAVGLYEVSRRLERDEPLTFPAILGVIWRERTRQIPWAGAVIVIYFLFWSFFAHMLFALFMGPSAMTGPPDDLATYLSGPGLSLLLVGMGFGALFAFLLFSLTVVSLPLLLDLEVDFVTGMRLSLNLVRTNLSVMLVWAMTISGLTFLALLPYFLGLFIVLPVLGHATWHLYRRTITTA